MYCVNVKFASIKSLIPSKAVAILIGIYSMNEKSNATSRFKFLNIPPTIVAPLLLIPGSSATTWNSPIIIASFSVISLELFIPLKSFIINKNIDVISSVNPTNFTFSSK